MPSHDFLTLIANHNKARGITATFSEMKKTARRMERAYNDRKDPDLDPYAYVLDYSDETGETATDNVLAEQLERAARNAAAARRRLAAA